MNQDIFLLEKGIFAECVGECFIDEVASGIRHVKSWNSKY